MQGLLILSISLPWQIKLIQSLAHFIGTQYVYLQDEYGLRVLLNWLAARVMIDIMLIQFL